MNSIPASSGYAATQLNAPRSRPRWGVSAAGAGLALILSACGASGSAASPATGTVAATGTTATSTTVAGNSNRAAGQAYRTCLTQHGVTLPTRPTQPPNETAPTGTGGARGGGFGGGFGSGGFGGGLQAVLADPANKAAVDACKSLLPTGGFGNGGNRGQALQAYYSCLSDNGVTVPTTVAGGPPPSIDRTTPAFTTANAKCQALLPKPSTNSSTTTSVVGG